MVHLKKSQNRYIGKYDYVLLETFAYLFWMLGLSCYRFVTLFSVRSTLKHYPFKTVANSLPAVVRK